MVFETTEWEGAEKKPQENLGADVNPEQKWCLNAQGNWPFDNCLNLEPQN